MVDLHRCPVWRWHSMAACLACIKCTVSSVVAKIAGSKAALIPIKSLLQRREPQTETSQTLKQSNPRLPTAQRSTYTPVE